MPVGIAAVLKEAEPTASRRFLVPTVGIRRLSLVRGHCTGVRREAFSAGIGSRATLPRLRRHGAGLVVTFSYVIRSFCELRLLVAA